MDNSTGQWLTYSELARVRGIGRPSAVKLAARERWQRASGNDRARTVRVLVPEDWLVKAKETLPDSVDHPPVSAEASGMLAAIEQAHRGEVEALKGQVEALRTVATAAEAKLADADARAEAAEDRSKQAQAEAAQARQRLEAMEAADRARQARGRLRRAWDGWRGR